MRAVLQRVSSASVLINGRDIRKINQGLLVLLGISHADTTEDVEWITGKIIRMRIFGDEEGKMNRSLEDIHGEILLVSQFTLHASVKKGNRPSFIDAAPPDIAIPLYEKCIAAFHSQLPDRVRTGEFGADMKITLVNDGPVTIIIDSKNPA
jgi:D-aminoacyl-tRNA deacylase